MIGHRRRAIRENERFLDVLPVSLSDCIHIHIYDHTYEYKYNKYE